MSTATDILRSIEQRAERAIVQELRLMARDILTMRATLLTADLHHADALLLKLGRLIEDQMVQPAAAGQTPAPSAPARSAEEPIAPSCTAYQVCFFDPEYGDLQDVALVETFTTAVQLACARLTPRARRQVEATWTAGRGALKVLSPGGTVLLSIEPIEWLNPQIQPDVMRACAALDNGDPTAMQHLFSPLLQVA